MIPKLGIIAGIPCFDRNIVDRVLKWFGTFIVPILVLLVSLVAFIAWPSPYASGTPEILEFRIRKIEGTADEQVAAQRLLETTSPTSTFDTHLSVAPHWLLFTLPGNGEIANVEFASRHATSVECWASAALDTPIGKANRSETSGALRAIKAGFSLRIDPSSATTHQFLCRGNYQGPARVQLLGWHSGQLEASAREFHRSSGLLEGGMVMLALFVLVIAIINREWTYFIFSGWLFANLRLAMLSAGWDTLWLEHTLPMSWLYPIRKFAFATYYALTVALFSSLFREQLTKRSMRGLLLAIQLPALPLLGSAALLPYATFLPLLWASAAFCIVGIAVLLTHILFTNRSRAAIWFSLSFALTLGAALYEIIAAALGVRFGLAALNHVTGALTSSLLASFALAERMREDHDLRRVAEAESMKAMRKMHDTYLASPIGLFSSNRTGQLVQFNPALEAAIANLGSNKIGGNWQVLWNSYDWRSLFDSVEPENAQEFELATRGSDGTPRWYLVQASLSDDLIEGSLQDITERRFAHDRLRFLADHDPLTELLNRRGIETALLNSFDALEDGLPVALAYIDLDRFKLVNDLYGHPTGDEVLRQIAQRIRATLGNDHAIARVGGDEFVMLFERLPIDFARAGCESVLEAIGGQSYGHGDKAFQLSASIGLVELASDMTMREAIATADRACREAKLGKHGRLVVYEYGTRRMRERLDEFHLTEQLGRGLPTDRLQLAMQPIVSAAAPFDSMNFEVLLRMRGPDDTLIPPQVLISAAEANGSMSLLDRWVMSTTLAWLDQHHDRLARTQFVCVNLSGASLNDERFMRDAFAILSEHERTASRVCFEVTESVALNDLGNTRRFIDGLKTRGAKVALDDFGAGYTSFTYLKELPADAIKIDGSFVKGMTAHPANVAIIQAIIELARNLGMKSIAEWVEDAQTARMLMEIGADYLQGYALVKPSAPQALLDAPSLADLIADAPTLDLLRARSAGLLPAASKSGELIGVPFDRWLLH